MKLQQGICMLQQEYKNYSFLDLENLDFILKGKTFQLNNA